MAVLLEFVAGLLEKRRPLGLVDTGGRDSFAMSLSVFADRPWPLVFSAVAVRMADGFRNGNLGTG